MEREDWLAGQQGPLDDVTVVEVANWVAAPSCTAVMADMGARVIKVEPLTGDAMRGKLRPPGRAGESPTTDYPFQLDNRGKRSVAVNLGDPRGASLVRELTTRADVFVTNLLPARLDRYRLTAPALRSAHPELIYALVTGYGVRGEEADRISFDTTAYFGRGGVLSLLGEPGDRPPSPRPGQGDHPTGLALLSAILAALRVRDRTGAGQVVATALLHNAAWSIGSDLSAALVDGAQPPTGRANPPGPMSTAYRCADGVWISIATSRQEIWERFALALGRRDLADDPRYATVQGRRDCRDELVAALEVEFAARPYAHWASSLDAVGILWSRIATLPDLVNDRQARANGMFTTVEHPTVGRFETLAAPLSMSMSRVAVRGPAPEPGEHTASVMAEIGIAPEQVTRLLADGVIGSHC